MPALVDVEQAVHHSVGHTVDRLARLELGVVRELQRTAERAVACVDA